MELQVTPIRFRLQLDRPLAVPADKYANVVRGALGMQLRAMSCSAECLKPAACPSGRVCAYARFFEGGEGAPAAPGGMRDAPRPFVLRVAPTAEGLTVGIHLFGQREELVPTFTEAVLRMCVAGLGPGRVRATMVAAESLNAEEEAQPLDIQRGSLPAAIRVPLYAMAETPERIRVRFLTATELKHEGGSAAGADFVALFSRVRDRVLFLARCYGSFGEEREYGEMARALGDRARGVRQVSEQLRPVETERVSTRTGQRHGLGGFVGWADYTGDFRELWAWLRAAEWTGVGRQTVWGKGQIRCEAGLTKGER